MLGRSLGLGRSFASPYGLRRQLGRPYGYGSKVLRISLWVILISLLLLLAATYHPRLLRISSAPSQDPGHYPEYSPEETEVSVAYPYDSRSSDRDGDIRQKINKKIDRVVELIEDLTE